MQRWYITFHGGDDPHAWNNFHVFDLDVLYPEGANEAVLTIGERSWTPPNPQLADVLAAVDVALASAEGSSRTVAGAPIETRTRNR